MPLNNTPFDVQIITSNSELKNFQPEWEKFLNKDALTSSLWQHPTIINFSLNAASKAKPTIIILRRNNKIECIGPCICSKTRFKFIFSVFKLQGPQVRLLEILGSDFVFSHNADKKACIYHIFDALRIIPGWDLIYIDNFCITNNLYKGLKQNNFLILNLKLSTTSPKIEKIRKHILGESYEKWFATLKGKTRGKIRRRIRSLYKKFPDQVELKVITSDSQVTGFLNALNELFPKTWQAKTFGTRARNTPQEIGYYEQIANSGWLRSYLLLIGQKPVAFLVGYQYHGIFHHAECGYDPEFAKFGVGSVLNYLMMADLYENHKPHELNFGFGENEYKKILGNESSDAFNAYITRPGTWRVLINFQCLLSYAEKKIRGIVYMLKLDTNIRKLLKRK